MSGPVMLLMISRPCRPSGSMKRIFYAMGYCGSGVAMSGFFGHKAALKILGDPEGETAFDGLPLEERFLL